MHKRCRKLRHRISLRQLFISISRVPDGEGILWFEIFPQKRTCWKLNPQFICLEVGPNGRFYPYKWNNAISLLRLSLASCLLFGHAFLTFCLLLWDEAARKPFPDVGFWDFKTIRNKSLLIINYSVFLYSVMASQNEVKQGIF